jgi:hypothetical protein
MGAACIVYENLADDGTITTSSNIAAAPPSFMQNAHTTRRWQGRNGASESILLTWSTAQSIDTIGLFKCAGIFSSAQRNLSSVATRRIRISSVDTTGLAGDLYDSGTAAGSISESYGQLIALRPAPVSAIAVMIDLSEVGAEALLAGRLVIGLRSQFSINFGHPWEQGYNDLSRLKKSAGGQTFIEQDDTHRVLNVNFDWVEETDRYAFVHETDRLNGIKKDVMFIVDPDSSDLGRDVIWGLMEDLNPPSNPFSNIYSKSYRISERL